ncbi:MAG: hypothetical protein ABIJ45_02295 [Candidatus Zixiibacteriota bacterium]
MFQKLTAILGFIICFLICSSSLMAEVPQLINYQGRLTNSSGEAVPDDNYIVTFRIWDDSLIGANVLWTEQDTLTTQGGLFATYLGDNSNLHLGIFGDSPRYLGIQLQGQGEIYPRTSLLSTPFTYHALVSDTGNVALGVVDDAITSSMIADGTIQLNDIAQNGAAVGQVMKWNGTNWEVADDDSGLDSKWSVTDSVLNTNEYWGLARGGVDNYYLGDSIQTHINFGVACSTRYSEYSTISGGFNNRLRNKYATIGGGINNQIDVNYAADGIYASTIAGGEGNRILGGNSSIGGGSNNMISHTGAGCTIAGGVSNNCYDGPQYATIGGGYGNKTEANFCTIAGGSSNNTGLGNGGPGSTVGGGFNNSAWSGSSTIGGGSGNTAYGSSATIAGGNSNQTNGEYTFIGGGSGNIAGANFSSVLGGWGNEASGYLSTVSGGRLNSATDTAAFVCGGFDNDATGAHSGTGAGRDNLASGRYSYAAGRGAHAEHDGTFVWTDSTDAEYYSTAPNQFLLRAGGGVGINTNAPTSDLHVNGSISRKYNIIDASGGNVQYTPLDSDNILIGNGDYDIQVDLPSATGIEGRTYTIKKGTGSGVLNIHPFGLESIDGNAAIITLTTYLYVTIISDGTNWYIIGRW